MRKEPNSFRLADHTPRMSYFGSPNVLGVNYELTQCPHTDRLASPIFVIVNKRRSLRHVATLNGLWNRTCTCTFERRFKYVSYSKRCCRSNFDLRGDGPRQQTCARGNGVGARHRVRLAVQSLYSCVLLWLACRKKARAEVRCRAALHCRDVSRHGIDSDVQQ